MESAGKPVRPFEKCREMGEGEGGHMQQGRLSEENLRGKLREGSKSFEGERSGLSRTATSSSRCSSSTQPKSFPFVFIFGEAVARSGSGQPPRYAPGSASTLPSPHLLLSARAPPPTLRRKPPAAPPPTSISLPRAHPRSARRGPYQHSALRIGAAAGDGQAAETSCAWVIDAAVNTALSSGACGPGDDPSFRAELVELARHIREGVYVEPYGWDTFGRPVGEGNFSPPSSKQLSGSTGLVDNSSFFTALHGNDSDSGEGLRELRMPSPSSKPLPSTSRPASESRHSRAPLIEELERIAPSVAMAPATLKAKRELPPSVDIRESDQTVTYALRLPNVSSQAQISVRVIDPARLIVETNDMEWSTQLREDVVADRHTAKFVKNSKTLKVSFALRSAQH
ncbi:hypothetical protein DFJ73DRAFT_932762 [Zopfochytrium polystomum]|nr:hypothetical protein DFJ73DRAFT_932762 [Zopfochytrium polystomum]